MFWSICISVSFQVSSCFPVCLNIWVHSCIFSSLFVCFGLSWSIYSFQSIHCIPVCSYIYSSLCMSFTFSCFNSCFIPCVDIIYLYLFQSVHPHLFTSVFIFSSVLRLFIRSSLYISMSLYFYVLIFLCFIFHIFVFYVFGLYLCVASLFILTFLWFQSLSLCFQSLCFTSFFSCFHFSIYNYISFSSSNSFNMFVCSSFHIFYFSCSICLLSLANPVKWQKLSKKKNKHLHRIQT
jgi:hypothetical protein